MDQEFVSQLRETAAGIMSLQALLVLQDSAPICEYYRHGITPQTRLHGRSITKSIVSALIGIAMARGLITGVEDKVLELVPELTPSDGDPRKRDISLDHLLTMTSGFAWANDASWYHDGAPSAAEHAFERALDAPPGTVFNYDSASTDLLTVILSKVAQQPARSFAQDHLFGPLEIAHFDWEQDPAGYDRGSAGLIMRPRDVAKIGQLYLQSGFWHDRSIVPQEWIEQSTITRVHTASGEGYGRLWWVEASPHRFSGIGFGGQFLTVIPRFGLVVVANQDLTEVEHVANQQERELTQRILNPVIAAVMRAG